MKQSDPATQSDPASQPNTARRGRPPRSEQQLENSRQLIVDAARALFATEGYQGVSMRKVAAKANCLPSMLYAFFPNKRTLLHFLWEGVFSDLVMLMERVYAETAATDRLQALCLASIDFWLQRPEDYRAIFLVEDIPQTAEDSYFVDSSQVLPRFSIYDKAIAEAQQRGELRAGDPTEIKNILLCAIQGLVFNLVNIPEYPWGDPKRMRDETVRILIKGLGKDA